MTVAAGLGDDSTSRDPTWITSLGPLVVVPVSALPRWLGATGAGLTNTADDEVWDDCERACRVDGLVGTITVGAQGMRALVLADEPAMTCYLPEHRAFVRWIAANSETELVRAALAVLADPATAWEECGTWETDGPAVLMDSARAGSELDLPGSDDQTPEHAIVAITAGRWVVRTVYTEATRAVWMVLVQLTR